MTWSYLIAKSICRKLEATYGQTNLSIPHARDIGHYCCQHGPDCWQSPFAGSISAVCVGRCDWSVIDVRLHRDHLVLRSFAVYARILYTADRYGLALQLWLRPRIPPQRLLLAWRRTGLVGNDNNITCLAATNA